MASFEKILVANRGEIAVRVIKTAKRLGYRTVAVYSEADSQALHTISADQSVLIGPAAVGESYLSIEKIIAAAKLTGADAIHPGYGFLSENAAFAQACHDNNIVFIGPSIEAIELMGSKRQSKIAMIAAGVPCVPGYEGDDQSTENLIQQARNIGTPLMIKASAGGGGRGMRLVHDINEVESQLASAKSEATNAFGSGELILEKAVISPRHVEIQVFGDQQGNYVYLWERDCSIQRRHQKVVEEAPSPAVSPALRQRMGEAAVQAAAACQYTGAGTVEFLLASNGEFYFLEMNTRLQVEHPVTELITHQDLVEWQINVAQGKPLPIEQAKLPLDGHAIEVRLYAEDPSNGFMPQTGPVLHWNSPGHGYRDIRVDHGIVEGCSVSPFYDPMLAKLITWGKDRDDAIRKLKRLIEDTELLGVKTNKTFLANVINHPVFREGEATTYFIQDHFQTDPSLEPGIPNSKLLAAATLAQEHQASAWHSSHNMKRSITWEVNGQKYLTVLEPCGFDHQQYQAYCNGAPIGTIKLITRSGKEISYLFEGVRYNNRFILKQNTLYIADSSGDWAFENLTHAPAASLTVAGSGKIPAPMDGAIVNVQCEVGQSVNKGQTLAIMEAMKMEHQLKADKDGMIELLNIKPGDQVKGKQILIEISANSE